MSRNARPFLFAMLLVAIGLRSVFGAPCCFNDAAFAQEVDAPVANDVHHIHESDEPMSHGEHGDDPAANPCCSACGPTLPPDPVMIAESKPTLALPEPSPIRALATRPPYPAYDATGPPLLT